MGFSLINSGGSGSVKDNAIATYSYSEDVTSLEPSNLSGGTSQVNVSAIAVEGDTVGDTHPNSNLLINNWMRLNDDARGYVRFQVKKLNNSSGIVSLTGDTLMSRLNIVATAEPYGGVGGAPLSGAFEYYCGLAGVLLSVDDELFAQTLEATKVNFIGWTGNIWEHIKMLCAAITIDGTGIEAYVQGDFLRLRRAKITDANYVGKIVDESISIDVFDSSQDVEVFNYNTSYGVDKIVQEQNLTITSFENIDNVSITDSMQVDAGQTITKRFSINASLESVKQPTCVDAIFPLPYSGSTGQYVIVGNDDLPIDPDEWTGQGGSLTVSLTDNPNEIEISIVAPPSVTMPTAANPAEVTNAPYKIGVESSGGQDYPAFYVVGTGVFFKKTSNIFLTGAGQEDASKKSAMSIDNPFITNKIDQATSGIAAAQAVCGPNISLTQTVVASCAFGSTPGTVQSIKSNKYRAISVSYGPSTTSITSSAYAKFASFNTIWTDKTFDDFSNTVFSLDVNPGSALNFNEFTVIPLLEA